MSDLNPHKTVLIVVDMQKDFYAEGGDASSRGRKKGVAWAGRFTGLRGADGC